MIGAMMLFGDVIRDAQRECESDKEKAKFERMLEDQRKSLYPTAEEGQKKLGTTLELLQWKAKNGTSDKAFYEVLCEPKRKTKNTLPLQLRVSYIVIKCMHILFYLLLLESSFI